MTSVVSAHRQLDGAGFSVRRPLSTAGIPRVEDVYRPAQALVIAGEPIREPVARRGPFVMNAEDELRQALEAYQTGRFGVIQREA